MSAKGKEKNKRQAAEMTNSLLQPCGQSLGNYSQLLSFSCGYFFIIILILRVLGNMKWVHEHLCNLFHCTGTASLSPEK